MIEENLIEEPIIEEIPEEVEEVFEETNEEFFEEEPQREVKNDYNEYLTATKDICHISEDGDVVFNSENSWKDFDISFDDYFYMKNHLDDDNAPNIDLLYQKIYSEVAKKCNETREYTIDCWNNRYTVRKIDEIEQIHYDAMSDEEKAEYDNMKYLAETGIKRVERDEAINSIMWRIERYEQQIKLEIETTDTEETYFKILRYIQYLRDFTKLENWWNLNVPDFEEWKE